MTVNVNIYLRIPPVKTLSLGGGARGSVYGPVLQHLEKAEILPTVEEVYGVSAGAITSNLLAYGATGEEITFLTNETNFKSLLKKNSLFKGGKGIFFTDKLKEMVNQQGKALFSKRIEEGLADCENQHSLGQIDKDRYKFLLSELDSLQQGIDKITFKDLERLKAIFTELGQPNKIKLLSVLAVSTPEGKSYLFSAKTYPDVLIADAVVASCAIPPVFKPHQINVNGEVKNFMDGGLHRSLLNPSHQVNFKSNLEKRLDTMELLLLPNNLSTTKKFLFDIFSGEGSSNIHVYGKPKSLGFIFVFIGYLAKLLFGADGIRGRYEMQKELKEYGHNVVSMDVDIKPNDFGISLEKKIAAGQQAVRSVDNYLQERRQPNNGYMLQGTPTTCLYSVPFEQFDEALNDIKRDLTAQMNKLDNDKISQKNKLRRELTFLDDISPKIKTHRAQQFELQLQISTLVATIKEHVKNNKDLVHNDLATLEQLVRSYRNQPVKSDEISRISQERLHNAMQSQIKDMQSLLKEHEVPIEKSSFLDQFSLDEADPLQHNRLIQ